MQEQAEEQVLDTEELPYLLFAADPVFNPGVVGLTASKLMDKYYRPAIVAQLGETHTRASCRSIPEFHITEALDQCTDLLTHHGGHAAAAGFTVPNENLSELIDRLQQMAADKLHLEDLRPVLFADMEVPLKALTFELLEHLDYLQPTGYGNSTPVFVTRNLLVRQCRLVGREKSHLKLTVSDGRYNLDGIAFRQGHWHRKLPSRIDVIYRFERNEFNGRVTPQMNIQDIKPAGSDDT
jgi:single-stranded-DNA-specific exonuclease